MLAGYAPSSHCSECCWPSVLTVTTKLFDYGQVDHADVCAALGLTNDGGPGSVGLAMIRTGSAPGTFTVTRCSS